MEGERFVWPRTFACPPRRPFQSIGATAAISAKLPHGLGEVLDPAIVRTTLRSIWTNNYHESLRDRVNTWRVFALDDEGGLSVCAWPAGTRRPAIPLPYHSENMTGFEWAAATAMVVFGMTGEAEEAASAIRRRYDGNRRNPWNEIECGSNYARSMAAYGLLQAYSGFQYDMPDGFIGFDPVPRGNFRAFWSLGIAWGLYERSGDEETVRVIDGELTLRKVGLKGERLSLDGRTIEARRADGKLVLAYPLKLCAGMAAVCRPA